MIMKVFVTSDYSDRYINDMTENINKWIQLNIHNGYEFKEQTTTCCQCTVGTKIVITVWMDKGVNRS